MTDLLNKLKRLGKQLLGFVPSKLPVGLTEFNDFCDSIVEIYNPPGDLRTIRFVVATLIMRLNPTEAFKPKVYFALALRRGAAGQVAAYAMEQIKQEQAAEQKAAKEKLEATSQSDASNDKPLQN